MKQTGRLCGLAAVAGVLLLSISGGCPPVNSGGADESIQAVIGISSTRGTAPLRIFVSAANSFSENGSITKYAWDFAGQATADTITASHLFSGPGRFAVGLTITDSAGGEATSAVEVQVGGSAENQPVSVIKTNVNGGRAPLTVRFDGTDSFAPDDVITDFFWDFGDGGQDRGPTATRVYPFEGEFTVTLRVVSGGGLEASSQRLIAVGSRLASLAFDDGEQAILPFEASDGLTQFTLEAWIRPDQGGTFVTIGGFSVEADPTGNTIRIISGETGEAPAEGLADDWHHVAIAYDAAGDTAIYLNGTEVGTAQFRSAAEADHVLLGGGYSGKLAELRIWDGVRTVEDITGTLRRRLSGSEADLLGHWPMDHQAGQSVTNTTGNADTGALGTNGEAELIDPSWSTDGPVLD